MPKRARLLGEAGRTPRSSRTTASRCSARGCELIGETAFDAGERITHELMPVAALRDRVRDNGTLRSGMMLVAILWWLDGEGSPPLASSAPSALVLREPALPAEEGADLPYHSCASIGVMRDRDVIGSAGEGLLRARGARSLQGLVTLRLGLAIDRDVRARRRGIVATGSLTFSRRMVSSRSVTLSTVRPSSGLRSTTSSTTAAPRPASPT